MQARLWSEYRSHEIIYRLKIRQLTARVGIVHGGRPGSLLSTSYKFFQSFKHLLPPPITTSEVLPHSRLLFQTSAPPQVGDCAVCRWLSELVGCSLQWAGQLEDLEFAFCVVWGISWAKKSWFRDGHGSEWEQVGVCLSSVMAWQRNKSLSVETPWRGPKLLDCDWAGVGEGKGWETFNLYSGLCIFRCVLAWEKKKWALYQFLINWNDK
jgi:hypothetical protein